MAWSIWGGRENMVENLFDGSMDSFLIVAFIGGITYAIFTLNFKSLAWFLSIPASFFLLSKINRLLGEEYIFVFMILFVSLCIYSLFAIMNGLDALGGRSEKYYTKYDRSIKYKEENDYDEHKNYQSEKICIDDEFYLSEEKENANNKQDKTKTISNAPKTTQHNNKEILVYEHLSPQDIDNLQEILESTNPDTPRIIKCHNCGSKLRVPAHKKIEITCPHCKATRRLAT